MPVQSGTSTPWREIAHPSTDEGYAIVYFRPGEASGTADLLAEQMRADGVIQSLGPAIRMAGEAKLELGWYGRGEDGEDTLCDKDGWTPPGGSVDEPRRCVLAIVDVSEA